MNGQNFLGRWRLVSTDENFDDYLKKLGVGMIKRKLAGTAKPDVIFSCSEDAKWTFKTMSPIKTHEVNFKMNQPTALETPDGRTMKTTIILDDEYTMIQKEEKIASSGVDNIITRVVKGNQMHVTCQCQDLQSVRIYEKVGDK